MADTYTRIVLTVIALALVTIALRLGASPVPSAWAKGTAVVSDLASFTIQQSLFNDLLGPSGNPASLSWLFEW